jgi:hypothetical protein
MTRRRAARRLSAALFLVVVLGCQAESVPRNVEISYRFPEGRLRGLRLIRADLP